MLAELTLSSARESHVSIDGMIWVSDDKILNMSVFHFGLAASMKTSWASLSHAKL